MKKIGIITIPDYNNYGNRLQNYAVKRYFEKKGFTVDTLEMNDELFPKYKARQKKLQMKKLGLVPLIFLFEASRKGVSGAKRYLCFERFTRKYLNVKYFPQYNKAMYQALGEEYDYFVLGSDQIWHPGVNETPNLFFALFAPVEKRLFFAPSFGVEQLDGAYARLVQQGLQGVRKISVREASGKQILQNLTNAEVTVLCDPTLCLSRQEWEMLAEKPAGIPDRYVLSCFLGPLNAQYCQVREEICQALGCGCDTIADPSNRGAFETGPSEFIYSILNAEFVVTDSFHAAVFSIIFGKPFLVFSRLKPDGASAGLDSRIDSLLATFHMEERKFSQHCDICRLLEPPLEESAVCAELRNAVDAYFDGI